MIDRRQSDGFNLDVRSRTDCETRHTARIGAVPAIVFAFLTDSERMMSWFARDVKADPRPGGMFRLTDFSGFWIEGTYVEVIAYRRVVFTWGGIEGLKLGQSLSISLCARTALARSFGCAISGCLVRRSWRIVAAESARDC